MNLSTGFRGYQLPHFLDDMEMSLFLSRLDIRYYNTGKQNLDDIRQKIEGFTRFEDTQTCPPPGSIRSRRS